jgi:membrane protein YdbS with pleckstrin-like domain/RNA polymerase subunit RPABC4/transcription elongation factor Spt4
MNRIYCSNCGKLIPGNSNFCRFCGAAQHGRDATAYQARGPVVQVHPQLVGKQALASAMVPEEESQTIERRHLEGRAKIPFFLNYLGKTFMIFIGLAALVLIDPLLAAALLVVYLFLVYAVTALVFNHFYFSIDKTHFNKEFGIFHKKHVTIPFEQVQNVNIKRTLIDQILGLARIDIESAGSSEVNKKEIIGGSVSLAEGHLPGLSLDDAKEFHDLLLKRVSEAQ